MAVLSDQSLVNSDLVLFSVALAARLEPQPKWY